ncbi:MAG: ABC transporter substrate-binding protein [Tissierellia bacterium]|nr:ABC transporter substrate-binding protein [Tissierellia bacterium]
MKKTRLYASLGLVLTSLFLLSACGGTPNIGGGGEEKQLEEAQAPQTQDQDLEETYTDAAGREVTLKKPLDNIIVNNYDLGESFAMVLGEDYVDIISGTCTSNYLSNRDAYEKHYPKMKNLKSLGGGRGPYDLEAIFELDPDVFFMNSSDGFMDSRGEEIEKIEKAGIPVFVFYMYQDPILAPRETLRYIGEIFDREERAKEVTDFIDQQFALVEERLAQVEEPVTFYYERTSGMTSAKDGWYTILTKAGGQCIAEDLMVANSGKLDPETVLTENPDFIVLSGGIGYHSDSEEAEIDDFVASLRARPGWEDLDAIKEKKLFAFAHDFSRSPLSFYPILYMAKEFYPEEMKDVDPDAILKEFYDRFMIVDYEDGTWSYQID